MPRTRSLAWPELKIGILTVVAAAVMAFTIFSVIGSRGMFWQRYYLKTRFDNVAGLKPGSPTRVSGVEVGSVTDVAFTGDQVEVTMQVNKSMRERITTGATASLGSVSLLGESSVDITPSSQGTPIPEWGYVPQGRSRGQIADMTETASAGMEQVTALVKGLREGQGTVGQLLVNKKLYEDLQRFIATAGDLARGIREGQGTLGHLVNDPKAAEALDRTLANLEAMSREINAGQGSLGKLLKDDAFSRSLTGATTNLETLTAKMNRGEGTVGKLMTDEALYGRLTSLVERLGAVTTRLEEGEGTAGQLLKDKQLYENMNGVVTDLRSLVADIRRDPKKYLNVRISVF